LTDFWQIQTIEPVALDLSWPGIQPSSFEQIGFEQIGFEQIGFEQIGFEQIGPLCID